MKAWRILIAVLFLLTTLKAANGGGTAKVRFIRYNGDGNGSNGHCCDGRYPFCFGACEHEFSICVGNRHSSSSMSDCPYFKATSTTHEQDRNVNVFNDYVGSIPNPIVFNVASFENGIRLKIRVIDADSINAHDHVDDLSSLISVNADRSSALATYKDFIISGRTSMVLRYMAYCSPDYYSSHCNVYCKATNDNSGHYTCDPSSGRKVCLPGWTGENCDQDVDECLSTPCLNGATCTNTNGGFTCECTRAYAGPRCEVDFRSCNSDPCLNGATCLNLNLTHVCQCTPEWTGTLCETEVTLCHSLPCLHNANCTGNKTDYSCSCDLEWRGQNCSISTVVDFTGDPSWVLLEGNITDQNRDDLHEGLKGLIQHTLNVPDTSRVYVKEAVLIRNEWSPTEVTEVQFIAATNLGHDVFRQNDTNFALRNETVVESYLPLPVFHPPPEAQGGAGGPGVTSANTQSWGANNWYIPFAVVLAILIIAAIIGYVIITRRRREKLNRLQEPTISAPSSGHNNLAFENVLYTNNSNRTNSDVMAREQNAQNEANGHAVPVEYSTPVTRSPHVLEGAVGGAVGGADGGYQEIDPAKVKAKALEADLHNPALSFTNTKTEYLRPCLNMEGNDYQDFNNISSRPEEGATGGMLQEENPYQEVGHPVRLGQGYEVDEKAFKELFDSDDDDDDDILKKPPPSPPVPELPARNASMSASSPEEAEKEEADEWCNPDWEKLRDELVAQKDLV